MKASNLSTVKCLLGEKILYRLWATIPKDKVNCYATDPLPTPPVFLQKRGGRNVYIFTHAHMHAYTHAHTHTHTHTHTHAYTHRVINKITLENRFWDSDVCLQEVWSRGMFSGTSPEKDQGKQDWAEGEPPTGPYLGTRYSLSSGGNLSDALQHPLQTHIWVFWLFHCNSLDIRKHVNQDWKVISKWQ